MRAERWLAAGAPVIAVITVTAGLELGAGDRLRAAVVTGAAPSAGSGGLAWQIIVADEEHGLREGVAHLDVDVAAHAAGGSATWHGATNGDGVAEVFLPLPATQAVTLDVRSGGRVLAQGEAAMALPPAPSAPASPWAPFARREGPVELDVTVLGERVAPSFPASIWVRARDAATHAPIAGADVTPEEDSSLASVTARARADSRGWAELIVTPAGLAVSLSLAARAADGRTGRWIGGLVASPGAARIATRERWSPDEPVVVDVLAPPTRATAYVEIDDAHGRAWATAVDLSPQAGGGAAAGAVHGPSLGSGLYWVVAAGDPAGASTLGAGTSALPFFVAKTDDAALAAGTDPDACTPARDVREGPRALKTCLALATASGVARWTALDGFVAQRLLQAHKRSQGLAVALSGVALAVLLEAALLLRAGAAVRAAVGSSVPVDARRWTLAVALLTGLLGFALLAAFLLRLS